MRPNSGAPYRRTPTLPAATTLPFERTAMSATAANLSNFGSARWQVQYFFDSLSRKDMMTATNSLLESETIQEDAQIVERYIRIGSSTKNFFE